MEKTRNHGRRERPGRSQPQKEATLGGWADASVDKVQSQHPLKNLAGCCKLVIAALPWEGKEGLWALVPTKLKW